jgi:hypothetical protein
VRLPRFFGKKRGHRRTGSQAWASLGDATFHAALLAAGLAFGGLLVSGVAVPEWRINHDFVPTECAILGKGLMRRSVARPGASPSSTWQPCLRVRYDAGGTSVEAWSGAARSTITADRDEAVRRLAAWNIGSRVPGWYDPSDVGSIVLERGYNWPMWLLALVLPGALIVLGGSGLVRTLRRWGRSEERCAARSGLSGILDPLADAPRHAHDHPSVPACDDFVNSPGTFLAYRLPIESPESWSLIGFGLFAALWNSVLAVLAVGAGLDLLGGRIDWFLIALLVPFAVVGVAGIVVFARGLLLATAVGTTQVEIAAQPLIPGGTYDVLVAQGGSGGIERLDLDLELAEQATFRQGTDTRTERLTVWRQRVQSWRDLTLAPGTRFEGRAIVTIPATAMHSFVSEHNAVGWRLVVRGAPVRWPPFMRAFPLVVRPAPAEQPRVVDRRPSQATR